jgi:hypothetical protein
MKRRWHRTIRVELREICIAMQHGRTFGLIWLNPYLEFPQQRHLRVLHYPVPILGLADVIDGVLPFGAQMGGSME